MKPRGAIPGLGVKALWTGYESLDIETLIVDNTYNDKEQYGMIKVITAYTFEIDDSETAVSDILAQLDIARNLRAHSVGLMSCYSEFVETGVAKAICDALPFDVAGCTTAGNAVSSALGELMLCLLVFTSDEMRFSAGVSASLKTELEAPLDAAYRQARSALPGEPALLIAFAPITHKNTGELIVETLDRISGGVPLFGALAVDSIDILNFSRTYTLFNGEGTRDTLSFLLIYGDIRPSFFAASISREKIQKQKAVITKSEGNLVKEANGILFQTYLEQLGIMELRNGTTLSFAFMIDYQDGTQPRVRSVCSVTPEGYILFSGRMPQGATIALGDIDYPDVLYTTRDILDKLMKLKQSSCFLLFSCLTRYMVLDADTTAEMELVRSAFPAKPPYHFAYTGGEICPVYHEQGKLLNQFHNCSLVACAF